MIGFSLDYTRVAAIIELQDAQGWQSISETPRYRAQVDFVEVKTLDVYTLIVDKIDLSDDVIYTESMVFDVDKVLIDNAVTIESIEFDVTKPFSDDEEVSDTIIFNVDKLFSDDVTLSDPALFKVTKPLSDNVTQTDSASFLMAEGGSGAINGAGLNVTPIAQQKGRVFSA